jgi:hypothetical protein
MADESTIDATLAEAGLDPVGKMTCIPEGDEIRLAQGDGKPAPTYGDLKADRDRAVRALQRAGFVDNGGAEWKPPLGSWLGFGVGRIRTERGRQITAEGYSLAGDRQYKDGQLMRAAWSYLEAVMHRDASTPSHAIAKAPPPIQWPWDGGHWKPKSGLKDLARAGALIAAEIDVRLADLGAFVDLVVEACVAGGADRIGARAIVETSIEDVLENEGIEVGHPDHDWGASGAAAYAEELVLRHLEAVQS